MSWDDELPRPIEIGAETRLTTLRDAAEYLRAHFTTVSRNDMLVGAIEDLIGAAQSGKVADRRQAAEQVTRFLVAVRHLDERPAVRRSSGDVPQRIAAMLAGKRRPKR